MAISLNDRVAFLQSQQIFNETDPSDLPEIAEKLEEYTLPANSNLYTEGNTGNHFYFIYQGQIRLWKDDGEEITTHALLEKGDKFGEEALLLQKPRSSTATSLEDCHFLSLDKGDFNWLVNKFPEVKENIIELAYSHQQSRKKKFDWLQQKESIYIMTNRHPIELWIGMLKPIVILLLGGFLYSFASLIPALPSLPRNTGILLIIVGILWAFWEGIDWKNDFFIITNQRVIWLEQILFQSASRQETPLSAIQSINIHTTYFGRLLDYGTVTVRTFTGLGSLTLTNLKNPKHFKENIQEHLIRLRGKGEQANTDRMRQTIRESLGYEVEDPIETNFGILPLDDENARKQRLFKTRQIRGAEIIYHKHWWVLLSKAWFPTIAGSGLIAYLLFSYIETLLADVPTILLASFYVPMLLGIFLSLMVFVYHYVDWKNDIYKLTEDSLIDSDHKPFGSETSQSAFLKNIQSIQHSRNGILRLILNFGSVNIMVADAQFTFEEVPNPAQVQQDIYYRQEQMKSNEDAENAENERTRMAAWITAYHNVQTDEETITPEDPAYPALEDEEDDY
jgi:CRP/FNR family transcriptional regulator, cyclic AMP receptor protein